MGERKMKVIDVARETGLSRHSISYLYKETAQKVDLNTMEILCRLFECSVCDLFEVVDEE